MTEPTQTPADDEQLLPLLPPLLRVVAQGATVAAALRLAQERGGVRIYVPHVAAPDHDLVPFITLPGLQALSRAYAGEFPVVPKAERGLRALRDLLIHRTRSTMSVRQLALTHRLDRRRIQQIMAEGCEQLGDQEPDLFG